MRCGNQICLCFKEIIVVHVRKKTFLSQHNIREYLSIQAHNFHEGRFYIARYIRVASFCTLHNITLYVCMMRFDTVARVQGCVCSDASSA
jgi:hypothetical protein